ncbi:CocE/NonD family hydrolase [Fulvimarina sp. MAC8]|uniref:CocE/NonD family hydrolase n=1 Tax=Fulvimarina sp. MAC8 TaxID=3162874 RepID=UPI0032EC28D3
MADIIIEETVWIAMRDGIRLAAKIWRPEESGRVPAILEMIPYRRRDNKRVRDHEMHAHFAAHGYAGIRVDLRGSGDSEGVLTDEYLPQEMTDGLDVLAWIEAQDWSNGKVGMYGLSWGGFNGLQLAALRPPQIGAVVTVCSSDDRYSDDVHYMGGCLLTDNLSWASNMFAFNSCPPDPEIVGEKWREMWLQRLEGSGLWLKEWMSHPHRDAYWKSGSVCEDYSRIDVPVMAVSGWRDGYTNPVFRLMQKLDVPRRAIVGSWGHKYPHQGGPGPAIDFLGETMRWFDRWLKGDENGIEDEPMLRAWMAEPSSPMTPSAPGRWVGEDVWPSPLVEERAFHPTGNGWLFQSREDRRNLETLSISSPLSVGLFAGKWCSYAEDTDLPWDQRMEDGGAILFDTEPLEDDLEILGAPRAELEIVVDRPVAQVAVRLCAVAPDDRSARVSFGILNLCHYESHEYPTPLEPGKRYRVTVDLNNIAQRFPKGHRIRLAVSTSYWPLAWPAPEPARLTLYPEHSRLVLPVREPKEETLRDLGEPANAEGPPATMLAPADRSWNVTLGMGTNRVEAEIVNIDPLQRFEDIDLTVRREARETYTYTGTDYASIRGTVVQKRGFERGKWQIETVTRTTLTATKDAFLIRASLDAYEGEARVFARSWDETIPRKLV